MKKKKKSEQRPGLWLVSKIGGFRMLRYVKDETAKKI